MSETKTGLHRGTPGYAINFFRRDILVNLQFDLKRLEKEGIDELVCEKIQQLLSALVSAASAEPKGTFWGAAMHEVLRKYEKTYKRWNDIKGKDNVAIERRAELLEDLQDIRHKIANRCRTNSHALAEAQDLQVVTAINDALVDTINAVPGTFTALAKSAARFQLRAMAH
ncbi:hypothetical protein [Sinimarinibacterium flocculans]|uniref:hypothetical protein n=1 Tax=Sinimarinibacterium flocculans TaxID=985250 RepID=UPI003510D3E7